MKNLLMIMAFILNVRGEAKLDHDFFYFCIMLKTVKPRKLCKFKNLFMQIKI